MLRAKAEHYAKALPLSEVGLQAAGSTQAGLGVEMEEERQSLVQSRTSPGGSRRAHLHTVLAFLKLRQFLTLRTPFHPARSPVVRQNSRSRLAGFVRLRRAFGRRRAWPTGGPGP
jgi:hypothetical protein